MQGPKELAETENQMNNMENNMWDALGIVECRGLNHVRYHVEVYLQWSILQLDKESTPMIRHSGSSCSFLKGTFSKLGIPANIPSYPSKNLHRTYRNLRGTMKIPFESYKCPYQLALVWGDYAHGICLIGIGCGSILQHSYSKVEGS